MSSFYGLFQQGRCESITFVKLLSCFDDLVAVGTASGRVAVFQLVSSLPGRNKQVNIFICLTLCEGSMASSSRVVTVILCKNGTQPVLPDEIAVNMS